MFKFLVQSTRNSIRAIRTPVVTQKCSYQQNTIYRDNDENEYGYHQPSKQQTFYKKPQRSYNNYESKGGGTFVYRDFQFDNSYGETGTFHLKLIKYIAMENCKFDPLIPAKIRYSDYFPISDYATFAETLKETPTDQLPRLLVFAFTFKTNGDINNIVYALNAIDKLCEERISDMPYETILSTLYSMMFVVPRHLTKTKFYKAAMPLLVKNFEQKFEKHVFVQLTFYLGLWKRSKEGIELMSKVLQSNLLEYLDKLNKTDLAIVSNSAYRISLLIQNPKFLDQLKQETLNTPMKEDAFLATFIKSLRFNKVKEKEVYEKLKEDLVSYDLEKLHFKGLVHFFAYFSDGLWNDQEVCQIIVDACFKRLYENPETVNDMRAKDVVTFLWSCANLNVNVEMKDLEFLETIIINKIRKDEFRSTVDDLIECCFSLWILGLRSKEIMEEINSLDFSLFVTSKNSSRIRLNSRFRLLLSCVEIESPELLKKRLGKEKSFDESKPAEEYLLTSESLKNVNEFLNDFQEEFGIKEKSFVSPIKELNIAGILVKFNDEKKCYIEVVDKGLMLKFDKKPSVLMTLKKRLLEKLGYKVILLIPDDYATKETLKSHLLKHFPKSNSEVVNSEEVVAAA